jgi:hypothetical protein
MKLCKVLESCDDFFFTTIPPCQKLKPRVMTKKQVQRTPWYRPNEGKCYFNCLDPDAQLNKAENNTVKIPQYILNDSLSICL